MPTMTDQKATPVPGDHAAAENEASRGTGGSVGAGESGGGAYPNAREGEGKGSGGFMGHGGQTDIDYSGPEQLGDEKVEGVDNANGVTRGE
jgi:hypothetical protein